MKEEPEWQYIAGLLEGEGTFSIGKDNPHSGAVNPRYTASLKVSMTDREPVEYIAKVWGVPVRERKHRKKSWKRFFEADCPARMIRPTLGRIYPFLKSERRRKEANLIQSLRGSIEDSPQRGRAETPLAELKYRHWLYEQNQIVKGRGQLS